MRTERKRMAWAENTSNISRIGETSRHNMQRKNASKILAHESKMNIFALPREENHASNRQVT